MMLWMTIGIYGSDLLEHRFGVDRALASDPSRALQSCPVDAVVHFDAGSGSGHLSRITHVGTTHATPHKSSLQRSIYQQVSARPLKWLFICHVKA